MMWHVDRFFTYILSSAMVLLPLLFNPYSRRVFEPEKASALRILAILCVAGWLVAALSTRRRSGVGGRFPRTVLWSTAYLMLVYVAATVSSVAPRDSWAGSYEWRQGAVTFLACLALFLTAARADHTVTHLARLVGLMELTSAIVAAYGLLQYLDLDPITWHRVIEGRAFSTLGHPNFLAAYLVLILPVAVVRAVSSAAWRARGLHLAVAGLDALCLLLTFSRSGWLGLLAAGICLGALLPRIGTAGQAVLRRWLWLAGLAALGLAILASIAYLDPNGLFSSSPLEPVHSFLRGKSATAQVRSLIWSGTVQAIRERPWLGYGPETFRLSFPQAYPPLLSVYDGVTAAGDHAHNEWLDWALGTGVVGLAAYLLLLLAVLVKAVRSLSLIAAPEWRWLQLGLIAGAIGYLVQNQLSFGTIAPLAHFWLFLGLTIGLTGQSSDDRSAEEIARPTTMVWRSRVGLGLAAVFTATAAYFIVAPDVKTLIADVYAAEAQQASGTGDWPAAVRRYDDALRLTASQDYYLAWQAEAYTALAADQNDEGAFARGEAALRRALELTPDDVAYWKGLGELYFEWGLSADPGRLDRATETYRRASVLSPTDPEVYGRWGRVYHAQKRYDDALKQYQQALTLDPLYAEGYTYAGETYLAIGQLGAAREMYDKVDEVTATIDRLVSKR